MQYELKGKQKMKSQRNDLFFTIVLVAILFSGCVISKKDEQFTGIEKSELKQVECGKTTRAELVDTFGEPTEQSMASNGAEIIKYPVSFLRCLNHYRSSSIGIQVIS